MTPAKLFTPAELIEIYPNVNAIGWTSTKIGIFFRAGLLNGFISGKEKKALITEESFIDLMKYYDIVTSKKKLF